MRREREIKEKGEILGVGGFYGKDRDDRSMPLKKTSTYATQAYKIYDNYIIYQRIFIYIRVRYEKRTLGMYVPDFLR